MTPLPRWLLAIYTGFLRAITFYDVRVIYRYCRLKMFRYHVERMQRRMESYRPRIPIKPQRPSQFLDSTKRNTPGACP